MSNAKWYDRAWNPFGNIDDLWPPTTYKPHLTGWRRKLSWWARNPLHNFTFHWIGVAGHVMSFEGEFLTNGWRLAWTHTKRFRFPIISYKGKRLEFYLGWRKNGGFGIALRKSDAKGAGQVT